MSAPYKRCKVFSRRFDVGWHSRQRRSRHRNRITSSRARPAFGGHEPAAPRIQPVSRQDGITHARHTLRRARKLAHLTCGWSYSLRYLPARTIYLSARGTELYCFLTTVFVTTLCRARHKLERARTLRPFLARFCMSSSHARRIALRESFCERYCTLLGVSIVFLFRLRAKQARRPSLRACFIFTVEVWVIGHSSA